MSRTNKRAWHKKIKGMTGTAVEAFLKALMMGAGGGRKIFDKSTRNSMVKVRVKKVPNITSGGRHTWVESNVGTIRKPLGEFSL